MQALSNYRSGSTGQLSAITVVLLFLGSVARVFTSVQDTGDTTMVVSYLAATAANAVLVSQLIYYWNVKPAPPAKRQGKGKKAKKVD